MILNYLYYKILKIELVEQVITIKILQNVQNSNYILNNIVVFFEQPRIYFSTHFDRVFQFDNRKGRLLP